VQESESKVALTRDAQADKSAMIQAAHRIFGRMLTEHEADACGHALAGQGNWHREQAIRKAERR
jgi:hypothetical protein